MRASILLCKLLIYLALASGLICVNTDLAIALNLLL